MFSSKPQTYIPPKQLQNRRPLLYLALIVLLLLIPVPSIQTPQGCSINTLLTPSTNCNNSWITFEPSIVIQGYYSLNSIDNLNTYHDFSIVVPSDWQLHTQPGPLSPQDQVSFYIPEQPRDNFVITISDRPREFDTKPSSTYQFADQVANIYRRSSGKFYTTNITLESPQKTFILISFDWTYQSPNQLIFHQVFPTFTFINPETETITKPSTTTCVTGGCSGQLCVDSANQSGAITTCEFRPEYACYQQAKCELQPNGQCGWTPTTALTQCLQKAR